MNPKKPYDLAKLDFEGQRKKKRKKLFKYTAIPIVIFLVVGIKLVSLSVINSMALKSYTTGKFVSAASQLQPLKVMNFIEPYIVHFNRGDALYRAGNFEGAQGEFETALRNAPENKTCIVRFNLVLALEAQGDKAVDDKDYDKAILKYDGAKAVIEGGASCAKSNNEESKKAAQKSEEADKRIEAKSEEAKQARNGDDKGGSNGDKSESTEEQETEKPSEEQQEQLQEKQDNAQRQRQKDMQRDRVDYDKNPGKYDRKVW
jgi:tetratricopeptide (TPR) repeat protein